MIAADDLLLAFHNERVAARRQARLLGVAEADALHAVLADVAARGGFAGVAALLAHRAEVREVDQQRRAAKAAQRQARRAADALRRDGPAATGWRAWFDGSATPNPGTVGIGALLCGPAGERVEISRRAGVGGSSDAEYLALIALLEAALAAGATPLAIHGDSQVVIGDVGAAGPAAKGMDDYRTRVRVLMAQVGDVTLRWVPRHRNGDADRLSQQAIRNPAWRTASPCASGLHGSDGGTGT